jgi:hypothetical protein
MTITRHGFKTVAVSKLSLPGDIEKRRKQPHVLELAASYEATGGQPAEAPVIERGTHKLVAGCDRMAAALNVGLKEIDVLVVSGTPEELERLSLVENVRRRHGGHDKEKRRLLALEHPTPAETFPEVDDDVEDEPPLAPRKPGRPSTGKGAAVAKVAALVGSTPEAVRSAAYRADKASEPPAPCAYAMGINTMCLKVPGEVKSDAAMETLFLEEIVRQLVKLQGECTRHLVAYPQLREALHEAASNARSNLPQSICPHCKCSKLQARCLACRGRGWLKVHEMKNIPPELKKSGKDAVVFVEGKLTKLSEVK